MLTRLHLCNFANIHLIRYIKRNFIQVWTSGEAIEPDVIWTHNLLSCSETRYLCCTRSASEVNSQWGMNEFRCYLLCLPKQITLLKYKWNTLLSMNHCIFQFGIICCAFNNSKLRITTILYIATQPSDLESDKLPLRHKVRSVFLAVITIRCGRAHCAAVSSVRARACTHLIFQCLL